MGQRHQAFLIAKVKPHGSTEAKYRCVAAYHHQWCYGTLPLRSVRRLITLLKQSENAEIIREELCLIDGKYGVFGKQPAIPARPCPFTATLLGAAWDMDLTRETAFFSGVTVENSLLHAGMNSWGGDNNDGITVVDITNPEDPAYCFLNSRRPLTGEDYVKGYYDVRDIRVKHGILPAVTEKVKDITGNSGADNAQVQAARVDDDTHDTIDGVVLPTDEELEAILNNPVVEGDGEDDDNDGRSAADEEAESVFERTILESIDDLDGERLLSYSALSEAWPREYPSIPLPESDAQAASTQETPPPNSVPSLVDISFRQTVEQSLESSDAVELDELPMFLEKMHIVGDVLSKLSPPPDTAAPLVLKLAESRYRDRSLDLAGYSFSDAQVLAAATSLPEIQTLNLSRNSTLTTKGVKDLLVVVPTLQRLILLDCPKVLDDELTKIAREEPSVFRNLVSIIHPAFMKFTKFSEKRFIPWPIPPDGTLPAGISIIFDKNSKLQGVTLPFLNLSYVLSGLIDIITARLDNEELYAFDMCAGRVVQVAYSALPREETKPWAERTIAMPLPLDPGVLTGERDGWALMLSQPLFGDQVFRYAFLRVRKGADSEASPEDEDTTKKAEEGSKPLSGIRKTLSAIGNLVTPGNKYPKLVKIEELPAYNLYDLRSFLDTATQEGCPAVPEATVKKLQNLMAKSAWRVMREQEVLNGKARWILM